MGVMICRRSECENIMCSTYIDGVGYICNECKKEFKIYLRKNNTNPESITEGNFKIHLKKFMTTDKESYGNEKTVDEIFQEYTNEV